MVNLLWMQSYVVFIIENDISFTRRLLAEVTSVERFIEDKARDSFTFVSLISTRKLMSFVSYLFIHSISM